jgi:hypothetical protein
LFNVLIKPTTLISTRLPKDLLQGMLNEDQLKYLESLEEHPLFSSLVRHIEDNEEKWVRFMNASNPEELIPDINADMSPIQKKLYVLILIKALRPDKFNPVAYDLVKTVLG